MMIQVVNALQFNVSNVESETAYHTALKGYLKTAGLLAEADPVIVSFVDDNNDVLPMLQLLLLQMV